MSEQELWELFLEIAIGIAYDTCCGYYTRKSSPSADFDRMFCRYVNFDELVDKQYEGPHLSVISIKDEYFDPCWNIVFDNGTELIDLLCERHPEFNTIRLMYV